MFTEPFKCRLNEKARRMAGSGLSERSVFVAHDLQDPHEQVDDVEIELCGAVNGIVEGARHFIGPHPVKADVTAEDERHCPVSPALLNVEDKGLHQLNHDHRQQCDKQQGCS